MDDIVKIVLTGGPCGGKTSALERIKSYFEKFNINVVLVPESATIAFGKGLKSGTEEFRNAVYEIQSENEEKSFLNSKGITLVVCDRGSMDAAAYYATGEFDSFLESRGSNRILEFERYDAVFHLVSVAVDSPEFYTNLNGHRRETILQAAELDKKTLSGWVGHNHLRIIGNKGSFEEKMQNLIDEIAFFIGIPKRYEIEKKFLIKKPDIAFLENMPLCRGIEITQVYLSAKEGENRRIRKRGVKGNFTYYYTEKIKKSDNIREENERTITAEEFNSFLKEAEPGCAPVSKTRYCFVYKNQYLELDIFPFMEKEAFLEIELKKPDEKYCLPPFVEVLGDVSRDKEFTNYSLAKKLKNNQL